MSRAARIGILAALAWVWAGPAGADVSRRLTLVRDGRPAAAIVIGAEAGFAPSFAAWELQLHIRKITGAELPIATDRDPPAGTRILVGAGRLTEALGLRGDAFKPQEYLIAFRPDTLVLMGCDRRDDAYPVCLDGRPERVEGRFGKALEFGGACRALSVEGPGFSDEAGTLEAWVWLGPRRLDAGTIFRLDGNPWTYHIVDTRGETVCYTVYDGSAGRSVASPKLADGWHHLCAVHDAAKGEFELFVDGASCGAAAYTLTTCAAAPYLHLGAFVSDGVARNRFVGRIDAARLSRVARAPSPGRADAPGAVDADTTVALDFDEESGPPREGSGRFRRPSPPPLRDAFEARGTCDAAFDFLERFCGVRWYAPTDLGLVHPTRATLQVEGADVRRAPAFEFRHHAPSGIAHAYVGLAPAPSDEELRLFVCRRRLGGRNFMTNHSFYDYYDRFWERNPARPDLFEGRRTEFFARGSGPCSRAAAAGASRRRWLRMRGRGWTRAPSTFSSFPWTTISTAGARPAGPFLMRRTGAATFPRARRARFSGLSPTGWRASCARRTPRGAWGRWPTSITPSRRPSNWSRTSLWDLVSTLATGGVPPWSGTTWRFTRGGAPRRPGGFTACGSINVFLTRGATCTVSGRSRGFTRTPSGGSSGCSPPTECGGSFSAAWPTISTGI